MIEELIVRGMVVGIFAENCWVVGSRHTHEAIVVDPGDQSEEILVMAKDMGLNIKLIVNSHGHLDHVLGVQGIKENTGAKFLIHRQEIDVLEKVSRECDRLLGKTVTSPTPDEFISDGDVVEVDGVRLQVIHTPGHTLGSVVFYTEGMLLSGDTLFRGGVGRTDLDGNDQMLLKSLDRLFELPDDTVVLPGHMEETTIGEEKTR